MKRALLLVPLLFLIPLLFGATQGNSPKPGVCVPYALASTADDFYIPTNGNPIFVCLEPDTAAAGTGTQVTMNDCSMQATATCALRYYDSNGDSVPDTAVLQGVSFPTNTRCTLLEGTGPYMLFDTTAFVDAGRLDICGVK